MPSARNRLLASAFTVAVLTGSAAAAPRVVTDIAPTQSIVAAVMAGVAEPELIVPPGASEHGYALRPSEARALEAAELVVWVGPSLTPWLADPLDVLASNAPRLALTEAPGIRLLDRRSGGPFPSEAHDPDEEEHHAEHAVDAPRPDPHVWLDPANAAAIAAAVAAELSALDPEHAAAYAANAETFAIEMAALTAELDARLAPLRGGGFLVFHDAYQYFEDRFDLPAAGSIALSDAESPRAPRVAAVSALIAQSDVACVFAEPQFEPKLIATVIEDSPVRTGVLDPLGAGLDPGPDLYPALMRGLADALGACLKTQS